MEQKNNPEKIAVRMICRNHLNPFRHVDTFGQEWRKKNNAPDLCPECHCEMKVEENLNTKIIYQPNGAAAEYSPLAVNLWLSCTHGCKYCYVPGALHRKPENFFLELPERKNVLSLLEKDCQKLKGDKRPILLCFACDPYQPHENGLTREALLILEKYEMNVQVLTKGGLRAIRDFDILKRNNWSFGVSINHISMSLTEKWEPGAASISSRIASLSQAREQGIFTWVSVEPVFDTGEALAAINLIKKHVNFFQIGKMNHMKEVESKIDWHKFIVDVKQLLSGHKYNIKNDLRKYE